MRRLIGTKFRAQKKLAWAKGDERYLRLAELDALLDGEFYDSLQYPFYQETTGGFGSRGKYIPVPERRPSFQYNLYNMIADQVARKLFGGRHAPSLVHPNEKKKLMLEALKEECKLEAKMIEATHWGSVGAVCSMFQIVEFNDGGKKKSKVIVRNIRAKHCTPFFNKLDELEKLRVHYPVKGGDFLNSYEDSREDYAGKAIEPDGSYWLIMELDAKSERVYKAIPIGEWAPLKGRDPNLFVELESTPHDLGFVPAHWHQYRTGTQKAYDGRCYWEAAIPNVIDLDYTVSLIGSGVRYNSVPQVVVKGDVINTEHADGAIGRGASRFLQVKADYKDGEMEEKNSDIYMLEAKGDGMKVGLEHWAALTLRVALQQICASQKDPNKLTTAMSGKGMEVLESEFLDLSQELRTVFGDEGYLKLLKKIAAACLKKNHVLMKGFTLEEIDALTLTWPPLSSIGMVEFQAMCMGLDKLIERMVLTSEEARTFALGQIDMPVTSGNKDYLPTVQAKDSNSADSEDPDSAEQGADTEEKKIADATGQLADAALERIANGPVNTKFH